MSVSVLMTNPGECRSKSMCMYDYNCSWKKPNADHSEESSCFSDFPHNLWDFPPNFHIWTWKLEIPLKVSSAYHVNEVNHVNTT